LPFSGAGEQAGRIVQSLTAAPARLKESPRIGEKLEEFKPREDRRVLVNPYEMRYEIRESTIYVPGIQEKNGNRLPAFLSASDKAIKRDQLWFIRLMRSFL
jgi:hypothetical protein